MEFQSSLQNLQRSPCCYYSSESTAIQITPWGFVSFNPEVLGRMGEQGKRRRPLPAARLAGGEGEAGEIREETETHPMVVFLGLGVAGLEVPRGAVALAATASGGGDILVR